MDKTRRLFVISGSLGMAGLLSGCMTKRLFMDRHYSESVASVLVTEDGKKIVVMGETYHYIFDAPQILTHTLGASYHGRVRSEFSGFYVDEKHNVSGRYTLFLDESTAISDRAEAIAHGYRENDAGQLYARGNLKGARYRSGGITVKTSRQQLNQTYTIWVRAAQTRGEKATKLPLTPVTVAVDGVLILAGVSLVFIVFMVQCDMGHGCK